MMMGLVKPTRGTIEILGEPAPTVASREHVGYLPEISYYYDYLKPEEILDFYGRLYGLDKSTRRKRVPELLERVGLADARGKSLRKFSKGMLQRIGLAQAIIANPRVVVLDEPKSGLDPLGRKDVSDLILELRDQGKTIFFSSHILSDVERICDRVAVMVEGRIVDIGPLSDLLNPRTLQTEIDVGHLDDEQVSAIGREFEGLDITETDAGHSIVVTGDREADRARQATERVQAVIAWLVEREIPIESVVPRREHLEDVFVREATHAPGDDSDTSEPTERD